MDKLRRALSGDAEEDEQDDSGLTRVMDQSTLSWGTRVKGFIACFLLGIVMSVVGSICVFFRHFVAFGIVYTLGNLIAMSSTCFLCGPLAQVGLRVKEVFWPGRNTVPRRLCNSETPSARRTDAQLLIKHVSFFRLKKCLRRRGLLRLFWFSSSWF